MGHSYRFKIGQDWRFHRPRPSAGRPGSTRPFYRAAQASAATILFGPLSERRSCGSRALRWASVSGLALESFFLLETGLPGKSRPVFGDSLAVLIRPSLLVRFFIPARAAVGLIVFIPGRMRPPLRSRLPLRSFCQRLDPDVVFLVGTPDFDGEGFRDPLGDFEFGGGVHDADGADVVLVDTATTANHRQQPARFRVLSAANGGAKPHAALRHAVTRR